MGYIMDALEYVIPAMAVIVLYVGGAAWLGRRKRGNPGILNLILEVVFGIYLVMLFSITVSPMYGFHKWIDWEAVNLTPLKALGYQKGSPLNLWGNIILFIPMGLFPVMLSYKFQRVVRTVGLGAGISFLIEFLQLFCGRGTDIDDLILNTIGTVVGFLIARAAIQISPAIRNRSGRESIHVIRLYCLLLLATVFVIGGVKRQQYLVYDGDMEENQSKIYQAQPVQEVSMDFSLQAENVCVLNGETGAVVYGKEKDTKVAPASTAKMVTALVVMQYASMNEVVNVGEELDHIARDASRAGLDKGDELSVENLLYGLLLPSGNDAAYALAAYTGRRIAGSNELSADEAIALFVNKMNEKAKELGAHTTHLIRPDGYDTKGQYTTANDLAKIAAAFIKNDSLAKIAKTSNWDCTYEDGRNVTYENTNQLINEKSEYYDEHVIGIKTGSSSQAGKCLVSAAKIKGTLYICVVMEDSEKGRFIDSLNIYHRMEAEE